MKIAESQGRARKERLGEPMYGYEFKLTGATLITKGLKGAV